MEVFRTLIPRLDPNQGCTLETCPPSKSIYGYRPNLGATIFFLVLFALSGLAYIWQGYKTRTKFFTGAMVLGSLSEVLGYVAKLLLWHDPFSETGFIMSVVLLTFAPAFYSGGIYYTLKYICITFGASLSRVQPYLYTWIFISSDVLSIALQAVGGAVASASDDLHVLKIGGDIQLAGLVFQVFTMVIFGVLAADYGLAAFRNRGHLNPATRELRSSWRFKLFLVALWVAYIGILMRCAYRVAELAKGWNNNPILREQNLFIGFDSVPVGVAALVLNIWHPGYCFPKETQEVAQQEAKEMSEESTSEGV